MRYVLDFGAANAGGAPTFTTYKRLDTLANLAQPAIVEIGDGQYYFIVDWTALGSVGDITFKATLNGIELSDVISGTPQPGSVAATAATSSTTGFEAVGRLVARAAVQCGILKLARASFATYDPFASTDPLIAQMIEMLDVLGIELAAQVKQHLEREFTLVTAGGALSYALPADYLEMLDDTQWNNTGIYPLSGPITPQEERFLHAWNGVTTVRIPYRVKGNRITFVIDPGNGLTISGLYISRYWVQTAASGTGPDADKVAAYNDFVLFDPTLVVFGLKYKFMAAKGNPAAPIALAEYEQRLEWAKGVDGGARVLSLNGRGTGGFRFVDNFNLPVTGWGLP